MIMTYEMIPLAYEYDGLEPAIDAKTMSVHYNKHYAWYTKKLNAAMTALWVWDQSIEELLRNIHRIPSTHQDAIRNNGGWYYNHSIFWELMTDQSSTISDEFRAILTDSFGSFDDFQKQFEQAAATRFWSWWAWLVLTKNGQCVVTSTPNQDNPLMSDVDVEWYPLLGLDVWEHAYYLHYQNRRTDYIAAWRDVVRRDAVEERYQQWQEMIRS